MGNDRSSGWVSTQMWDRRSGYYRIISTDIADRIASGSPAAFARPSRDPVGERGQNFKGSRNSSVSSRLWDACVAMHPVHVVSREVCTSHGLSPFLPRLASHLSGRFGHSPLHS